MAQLVLKGDCLQPWLYKRHTLVFLFYALFLLVQSRASYEIYVKLHFH